MRAEILGAEQKVERIQETPEHGLSLATDEESLFIQPKEYWTIRYQGHVALIKSIRGLHYLAILLRHPGRAFHVRELFAHPLDASTPSVGVAVPEQVTGGLFYGFPVLDAQAKAEYKRRINELRDELEEAERVNDAQRKTEIQNELQAICDNLASAVGLNGRDRKTCSDAERARSAVTKCIKKAIQKIGEAIPSLGYHLANSIKTGYFCSYNPHSDRAVAWKFYLSFLISIALGELSPPLCEL
jgi:non-specific serine/threonine protein kinase